MIEFTTDFIVEKNKLESEGKWVHLVEVVINANTTGYFTSYTDTLTYSGTTYAVLPMRISEEEQTTDGSLPSINVDISNLGGTVFDAIKNNDMILNNVTLRLINTNYLTGGDESQINMQILGAAFSEEAARFNLGFGFNVSAEGPIGTYNRRDHPSIPFSFRNFAILS